MSIRPTRSMTIALIVGGCLLLGSTGGAVAGGMITGADIKNSSVTGKDIKDKSLSTSDLSTPALSALTGPAGANGAPGAPGSPGAAGSTGFQNINGPDTSWAPSEQKQVEVQCPSGTTVLGGGFHEAGTSVLSLVSSGPNFSGGIYSWDVLIANPTVSSAHGVPFATCTKP
jgi:hypothetical protein